MLQAIAHLPLIALELLRHLRHRQGADSCTVILDTLVLTLIHNAHNLKCS